MTFEDRVAVLLVEEQIPLDRVYSYMLYKYWMKYCPQSSRTDGGLDTGSTEDPRNQCKQRIMVCQSSADTSKK